MVWPAKSRCQRAYRPKYRKQGSYGRSLSPLLAFLGLNGAAIAGTIMGENKNGRKVRCHKGAVENFFRVSASLRNGGQVRLCWILAAAELHRSFVGSRALLRATPRPQDDKLGQRRGAGQSLRSNARSKASDRCVRRTLAGSELRVRGSAVYVGRWALRCGPIRLGRLHPSASLRAGSRMRPSFHELWFVPM
jgi:hypothetical protein